MKIIRDRLRKDYSNPALPYGRWIKVDQIVHPTDRTGANRRPSRPGKNQHRSTP